MPQLRGAPPPGLLCERAVYFMIAMDSGHVKIGLARDPWKRLSTIQTGCPEEVRMAGFLLPPNPDELERRLHERFAETRRRGEWFEWSDEMDAFLRDHVCRDYKALDRWINERGGYKARKRRSFAGGSE